jgi:hypothetical protein
MLCVADSVRRLCQGGAAMQLILALFDLADPSHKTPSQGLEAKPWDRIDEASRMAALEILARLIAQLVAAESEGPASND